MRFFYCLLAFIFVFKFSFAQLGAIKGFVNDHSNEVVPFTKIWLYKNDSLIANSSSDSLGNYYLKNLAPGKYNILGKKEGFKSEVITEVSVTVDKTSFIRLHLNKILNNDTIKKVQIDTINYSQPLIDKGHPSH